MKLTRISMTQLRHDTLAYCDRAEKGEEFIITKHGKPVARLVGIKAAVMEGFR